MAGRAHARHLTARVNVSLAKSPSARDRIGGPRAPGALLDQLDASPTVCGASHPVVVEAAAEAGPLDPGELHRVVEQGSHSRRVAIEVAFDVRDRVLAHRE